MPVVLGWIYYAIIKNGNNLTKNLREKEVVNGSGVCLCLGVIAISYINSWEQPYFIYGLWILTVINFIDDIKGVYFVWRLMAQFIACCFLLMENDLFYSYWSPFLLLISVGILNSFNFMDGINGITGSYGLSILFPIGVFVRLDQESTELTYALILFLVVFLFYNLRKNVRVWLGDVGSVGLAFLILNLCFRNFHGYGLYLTGLLCSIYLIDSGYTLIRRNIKKENVFKRHKQHLYQRLFSKAHLSEIRIAVIYFSLQLLLNTVLLSLENKNIQLLYGVVSFSSATLVYYLVKRKYEKELM